MERPLPSLLLTRALLVAIPFLVWFAWAAVARRTGREMGATPWAWLAAAGGLLLGLSLLFSVILQPDTRGEVYVPGETSADGRVTAGHFEKSARP